MFQNTYPSLDNGALCRTEKKGSKSFTASLCRAQSISTAASKAPSGVKRLPGGGADSHPARHAVAAEAVVDTL